MSPPIIELLPWDSAFLGFPVGRLVARNLDAAHLVALVAENSFTNFLNEVAKTDIDFPVVRAGDHA